MASLSTNQGSVLREPIKLFRHLSDKANIDFSSRGLSIIASQPLGSFLAILRIVSSACDYFICNKSGVIGADLMDMHNALLALNIADECSLSIGIVPQEGMILFSIEGKQEGRPVRKVFDIKSTEVNHSLFPMSSLPGTYLAAVGIPSEVFRRIFRHGTLMVMVHVSVRISQVKIHSVVQHADGRREDTEIILAPENGECTIEGVIGEESIMYVVNLYHVDSLVEASSLTDTVFMHVDNVEPLMINIPLGSLGRFMFLCFQNQN